MFDLSIISESDPLPDMISTTEGYDYYISTETEPKSGGGGEVYFYEGPGGKVALKIINDPSLGTFYSTDRALSKLSEHDRNDSKKYVLETRLLGYSTKNAYVIMEYMDMTLTDLKKLIIDDPTQFIEDNVSLNRQVLYSISQALHYLWLSHRVFLDIKTANVMANVSKSSVNDDKFIITEVKIIDIDSVTRYTINCNDKFTGTSTFPPPETWDIFTTKTMKPSDVITRSDYAVWSIGAFLLEWLALDRDLYKNFYWNRIPTDKNKAIEYFKKAREFFKTEPICNIFTTEWYNAIEYNEEGDYYGYRPSLRIIIDALKIMEV